MFEPTRTVMSIALSTLLIAGLSACEKREVAAEGNGPAETAGQQIDQATARAAEELNKIAEKTGKGLQAMGEKLQNEAQEAQEAPKKE
ncbi:MAG TPA: hypothetical protein VGE12_03215 [Noviherbaspirillum sp.]